MFQGIGKNFKVFGFEYWSDPNDPTSGYVEWVVDGTPSHRLGASAVSADPLDGGGSGVAQRLIPVEPMSIVLNLGISRTFRFFFFLSPILRHLLTHTNTPFFCSLTANWQTINTDSMMFPSEFLIDYVRVYQRKDQQNVGCNPPDFPTSDYIQNHIDAYMST